MQFLCGYGIIQVLNQGKVIESGCPLSILYKGGGMKVKPIAEVIAYLAPIADEVGVEIVDASWNLREKSLSFFIDAPSGVDLNLCETFHRAIDGPLDELDPTFGEPYTLNCSSVGLDRPFKTERDYLRHVGEKVEIHLYAPLEGSKYHEGVLLGLEEGCACVETAGGEKRFPLDKISKACLFIEI